MGIKRFKPTSPGRRFMTVDTFEDITRSEPERSLVAPLKKNGGRNSYGRITTRHKGGGHKRRYRIIDFKRDKDGVPAKVAHIEYDPNRSARIALLHYADGEKRYILAPQEPRGGRHGRVRRRRRHQGRQRAAAREHPVGHHDPQHRAPAGPRRPAGPQRRRQRAAAGQGEGLRRRPSPLRRAAPHPPHLPRDGGRARQLRPLEPLRRQGRPHPLARRAPDRARHGHEPRRPPARRRRGQDDGRPSSGHAVGRARRWATARAPSTSRQTSSSSAAASAASVGKAGGTF